MTVLTYKAIARTWISRIRYGMLSPVALLRPASRPHPPFRPKALRHHQDFLRHLTRNVSEYDRRRAMLAELARRPRPIVTEGYCICCNQIRKFSTDPVAQGLEFGSTPNCREGLGCPGCGQSSRMRASIHLLLGAVKPARESRIYLTEQVSSLFRWIKHSSL
jgi:hypothetical protein